VPDLTSRVRRALARGRPSFGSWVTLSDPAVAEIMCRAGFDWLAVDMEHSPLTIAEAAQLVRTISLCGVPPLVRLSSNDPVLAKRVMDAGASGVIVPMVNSAAEAEAATTMV
jgi:2-dehydro-3-deoxyglucarate aldolase